MGTVFNEKVCICKNKWNINSLSFLDTKKNLLINATNSIKKVGWNPAVPKSNFHSTARQIPAAGY